MIKIIPTISSGNLLATILPITTIDRILKVSSIDTLVETGTFFTDIPRIKPSIFHKKITTTFYSYSSFSIRIFDKVDYFKNEDDATQLQTVSNDILLNDTFDIIPRCAVTAIEGINGKGSFIPAFIHKLSKSNIPLFEPSNPNQSRCDMNSNSVKNFFKKILGIQSLDKNAPSDVQVAQVNAIEGYRKDVFRIIKTMLYGGVFVVLSTFSSCSPEYGKSNRYKQTMPLLLQAFNGLNSGLANGSKLINQAITTAGNLFGRTIKKLFSKYK